MNSPGHCDVQGQARTSVDYLKDKAPTVRRGCTVWYVVWHAVWYAVWYAAYCECGSLQLVYE